MSVIVNQVVNELLVLIRPRSQDDNLCLFYSILNAVPLHCVSAICMNRTPEEENGREFVSHSFNYNPDHSTEQNITSGFFSQDVFQYLKHLQQLHFITSFVWDIKKDFKTILPSFFFL